MKKAVLFQTVAVFMLFVYGGAEAEEGRNWRNLWHVLADDLPRCAEEFANFSKIMDSAKVDPVKVTTALQKGTPLSAVEAAQDHLESRGWVFPPPLNSNHPDLIHSALNKGAVTVALKASFTPEITRKLVNAVLARYIHRLVISWKGDVDIHSDNWLRDKKNLIATGQISKDEIEQFESELWEVGLELKYSLSKADRRDISWMGMIISETMSRPMTTLWGSRFGGEKQKRWVDVSYTLYGPSGSLFETEDGRPSAAFPGKQRFAVFGQNDRQLPWSATPRIPGRRLEIILAFEDKNLTQTETEPQKLDWSLGDPAFSFSR